MGFMENIFGKKEAPQETPRLRHASPKPKRIEMIPLSDAPLPEAMIDPNMREAAVDTSRERGRPVVYGETGRQAASIEIDTTRRKEVAAWMDEIMTGPLGSMLKLLPETRETLQYKMEGFYMHHAQSGMKSAEQMKADVLSDAKALARAIIKENQDLLDLRLRKMGS